MSKDDSGPAFPQHDARMAHGQVTSGMSLRDWFAGQALAGLAMYYGPTRPEAASNAAYRLANHMMAERGKTFAKPREDT